MRKLTVYESAMLWLLVLILAAPIGAQGQQGTDTASPQSYGASFRPEELDQMLAPIALYPDSLLAQVLTASTYPLEVVQAARFVEHNPGLKGDKLMEAVKGQDWDPSVKAMLGFPDVLAMMNEQLDWTTKLGDAFLAQQRDVMDSVQRLRDKAYEAGNLNSTKEQVVKVEKETQTIIIQPTNPQVVYVPAYNPTIVYGTWWYPAYPPYYYHPPGYVAGAAAFSFFAGVAVGAAWSGWGGWGCGWGHHDVNINVERYNNFTRNNYVNANRYEMNRNVKNKTWEHNPEHRRGAQYRDQSTAQRFGDRRAGSGPTRTDYRGFERGAGERADAGRDRSRSELGTRRPEAGSTRPDAGTARDSFRGSPGGRESALGGAGSGGMDRAASYRGQASRSSASRSSGGFRGGGGRARGRGGRR
jgi:hypothetical protein